jgi:hypothetical protein
LQRFRLFQQCIGSNAVASMLAAMDADAAPFHTPHNSRGKLPSTPSDSLMAAYRKSDYSTVRQA